jgi:hypothetical protein
MPDSRSRRRTPHEREAVRAHAAGLYLRGKTQTEIAQTLGVTQQQISYDLKIVRKRWEESAVREFAQRKSEELAKVDQLERTNWSGWEASWELNKPNPAFLRGVQWCIERRCALLGLDAAHWVRRELSAEAHRIAEEYGLDPKELLEEAEKIMRGE